MFESSSVAVISKSAAFIKVATSDKSLPVISTEISADLLPDVTVKEYVPLFWFVNVIFASPESVFAVSTPPVAVLIERLTLSIAANKSVLTPALVTMSWKTVPPSIVDSTKRLSES